jgi:alpha-glucosidase
MLGAILAAVVVAVTPEAVHKVVSPDGRNEIRVTEGEKLTYSVWRDGKVLVTDSPLAMDIKGKRFPGAVVGEKRSSVSGTLKTPIYKKSEISLAANLLKLDLGSGFAVELAARDDGVAYRFVTSFPEKKIIVRNETASLNLPSGDLSVWAGCPDVFSDGDGVARWLSNWEPVYTNLTAAKAGIMTKKLIALPMIVEYPDGTCISVTESDQRGYPGWMLRGADAPARFNGEFAREIEEEKCTGPYHLDKVFRRDYIAETAGTRAYPWRLVQIAGSCNKLIEGDAVYALAEPCRVKDVSWIKPGLAQWEWWHNWNVKGVGFKSGCNTATYLHYIDFAAGHGVPYLVMDAGWSSKNDIVVVKGNVDLKAVLAHAGKKGVKVVLWSPWAILIGRQEEAFAHYSKMGASGWKIDGICRNDRFFTEFAEETARIAAKYRMVIDYHGISKPSGLSRTYPNVLTYEGVHGLENTKWEGLDWMAKCDFPQCDLTDYFCRMTAGPMDYTPGAMRNFAEKEYNPSNAQPGSQGTRVHQLAMFTMFESPLQMLCDSPSAYRENPECFAFMCKVPTVWDETRALLGKIGDYAAIARRKGDTWFVGAMTDWQAREIGLPTSFLGEGEWTAEIVEDGVNADRDATDHVHRKAKVKAGEVIKIKMAPGGGWTARFHRRDINAE